MLVDKDLILVDPESEVKDSTLEELLEARVNTQVVLVSGVKDNTQVVLELVARVSTLEAQVSEVRVSTQVVLE